MYPSSVMGLSPSGNSPGELGYFFLLFCFSFLDEAFSVFPHVLVKHSFPNARLDARTSINTLRREKPLSRGDAHLLASTPKSWDARAWPA